MPHMYTKRNSALLKAIDEFEILDIPATQTSVGVAFRVLIIVNRVRERIQSDVIINGRDHML